MSAKIPEGVGVKVSLSGPRTIQIRNFLNPFSRVEFLECAMNPESCGR